jgi:hypothetical protein
MKCAGLTVWCTTSRASRLRRSSGSDWLAPAEGTISTIDLQNPLRRQGVLLFDTHLDVAVCLSGFIDKTGRQVPIEPFLACRHSATPPLSGGHMKRANEIEAAASKLNAPPPVPTQAVQTRRENLPRIREEHRESVLLCLPDELFREIGQHLPLEQWIALRQLCKTLSERVDRQPPFILLYPDVQTDALFCQFLRNETPEHAYKLANLVSKISMSEVFRRNDFGKIFEEIARAKSWERIEIHASHPLSVVTRPLLAALSHAPCGAKRKLAYYFTGEPSIFTSKDRASVEEVQLSASLQLITLKTSAVADFLPFIAGNAEFSDLDLDLNNSATLTCETFKALQQMQGSVKRLSLRSMGSIDSSEVLDALLDKGLESLNIDSSRPGNGIDLLPWLTLQLKSLILNESDPNPATLAEALGITEKLRTLEINYGSTWLRDRDGLLFKENIKSLVPALCMNHTIEHLSLSANSDRMNFNPFSAELLEAILNHTTIKHFEWSCGDSEWPELVAPIKPKAMDSLLLKNCSVGMDKIVYLLQQLSSLKCLHLEFTELARWNSEFLPLLSRLGVEEFSLHVGDLKQDSAFDNSLPIAECLFPGLNRFALDVDGWYSSTGMDVALASTVSLTSLKLHKFDCIEMSAGLVKGLVGNKSLERIELSLSIWDDNDVDDDPDIAIDTALGLAKIIEAILDHSSISYADIDCNSGGLGYEVFLPEGWRQLLENLNPGLQLVLSGTTKNPPEEVPFEKIQAVLNVYKRIAVEHYPMDESTTTKTSSAVH